MPHAVRTLTEGRRKTLSLARPASDRRSRDDQHKALAIGHSAVIAPHPIIDLGVHRLHASGQNGGYRHQYDGR
jgi:hypothetical protein